MLPKVWLPLLAFSLLCLFIWLTPLKTHTTGRTPLEIVAHDLGHSINSIWVGISLLVLIVPSLIARFANKDNNPWAWRALDAIFLDFLTVDVLGKDLLTGLVRPGPGNRPGFPSGHATMAYLMASLIWQRFPKLGPFWFLIATLISWSRVESHAHYPYQVIVGAIYGCGLSALIMQRSTGVLLPRILLSDERLRRELTR